MTTNIQTRLSLSLLHSLSAYDAHMWSVSVRSSVFVARRTHLCIWLSLLSVSLSLYSFCLSSPSVHLSLSPVCLSFSFLFLSFISICASVSLSCLSLFPTFPSGKRAWSSIHHTGVICGVIVCVC